MIRNSSITILNKNTNLPPLLLPILNISHNNSISNNNTDKVKPLIWNKNLSNFTNTNTNTFTKPSTLDNLASLATKINILDSDNNNTSSTHNNSSSMKNIATITPPPSITGKSDSSKFFDNNTDSGSSSCSSSNNLNIDESSITITTLKTSRRKKLNTNNTKNKRKNANNSDDSKSKQHNSNNSNNDNTKKNDNTLTSVIQPTKKRKLITNTKTNNDTIPNNNKNEFNSKHVNKRQRIGPSCDNCRLKKIKCNAHVEIIVQDDLIISSFTPLLHYVLTKDDIEQNKLLLTNKLNINLALLNLIDSDNLRLIKHIDKLIIFKPCSSCCKKKNSSIKSENDENITTDKSNSASPIMRKSELGNNDEINCLFSKGFTRADINIFTKISLFVVDKTIYQMDINDYKKAGY